MKAITLTQPWATLVAIGAKQIETRGWRTSYRGKLAIHAAAGYGKGGARAHKALCGTEPFCSVLNAACKAHYDALNKSGGVLRAMAESPFMPMGMIVATCELVDCQMIGVLPSGDPAYMAYDEFPPVLQAVQEPERSFGDYTAGRWAWILTNVRALPEPIPAKGALGLWAVQL